MLHVCRVYYGLSLKTARPPDSVILTESALSMSLMAIRAVCRYVSHADMTLRLRRWLHFKIISALLTVFEIMSENVDRYGNPDILRLRLRMWLAEVLGRFV